MRAAGRFHAHGPGPFKGEGGPASAGLSTPRWPECTGTGRRGVGPVLHTGPGQAPKIEGSSEKPASRYVPDIPQFVPMSNLKTFLVEDSPVIRSNLVAALEDLAPVQIVGFAETADEACDQLKALDEPGACDLAIVDVFLKAGSGLDVLRCLRGQGSSVRRVVLTNYASPEMRAQCLELGAEKVFDKSRDIEALVDYCNEIAAG